MLAPYDELRQRIEASAAAVASESALTCCVNLLAHLVTPTPTGRVVEVKGEQVWHPRDPSSGFEPDDKNVMRAGRVFRDAAIFGIDDRDAGTVYGAVLAHAVGMDDKRQEAQGILDKARRRLLHNAATPAVATVAGTHATDTPKALDKIAVEVEAALRKINRPATIADIAATAGRAEKTVTKRLHVLRDAGRVVGGDTRGSWQVAPTA